MHVMSARDPRVYSFLLAGKEFFLLVVSTTHIVIPPVLFEIMTYIYFSFAADIYHIFCREIL